MRTTYRETGDVPRHLLDIETVGGWAIWGITGAIQSQFNVTSVTDNGAGDWTVNWSVAFGATTYALAGCTRDIDAGSILCASNTADSITTTSARVMTGNSAGGRRDPTDGIYLMAVGRR